MQVMADLRSQFAVRVPAPRDYVQAKQGASRFALRGLCVDCVERLQDAHVDERLTSGSMDRASGMVAANYANYSFNP